MSCGMRFLTMWYGCSLIRAFASRLNILLLLTEHRLEFLYFKRGCTGSSESILVKMPHCWKSHIAVQLAKSIMCVQTAKALCGCPGSPGTTSVIMQ